MDFVVTDQMAYRIDYARCAGCDGPMPMARLGQQCSPECGAWLREVLPPEERGE